MQIRKKLKQILASCSSLKQDLREIKQDHRAYRLNFQNIQKQLCNYMKNYSYSIDKENDNPNLETIKNNQTSILTKRIAKKLQQQQLNARTMGLASRLAQQQKNRETIRPSLKMEYKTNPISQKNDFQSKLQNSFYTKRKDDTHNLKSKILQQLAQLKVLEKKEEFLRSTNERMKIYYSESKKNLQKCLSISKQLEKSSCKLKKKNQEPYLKNQCKTQEVSINSNSNYTYDTKTSDKIKFCISENSLIESDISIPVSLKPSKKNSEIDNQEAVSLYCQNNHQYYTGTISNKTKLPDGSGHLFFCCEKMPLLPNFIPTGKRPVHQSLSFYQGSFLNGKFEGLGTLGYRGKDQIKFVGEFHNNLRNGKGSLYCGGRAEIGLWKSDIFVSLI